MKLSNRTCKLLIALFWVAVWQIASLLIDNAILFVGPVDVLKTFSSLVFRWEFWRTIATSLWKISLGTLLAFAAGLGLGIAAYCFSFVKQLLEPIMVLLKSIPVASFVIIALIWFGSTNLSIFISFTVVLPTIYVNTAAGLAAADPQLLELTKVFRIPALKKIRMIYLPALFPYLISGCKTALGMSWKSGIAAEVIGIPAHSIGERLYMAKIYLNTAELFAWTATIIIVSALFERLILWVMALAERRLYKTTR